VIAIDWGTSSLRAWRLDGPSGRIVEQRRAALGILACDGRFEAVLAQQIDGWDDPKLLLAGMIGSRQGWREAPYVDCPATPAAIAAAVMPISAASLPGRQVAIVPGLQTRDADGVGDVMRGEETQVCGLIGDLGPGVHTLCLPGTHSKWVRVADGRIEAFRTAMTGEVYHVLRSHSILGRLMTEADAAFDPVAFDRGLARAERPGGLLHHAFGVRSEGLFGALAPKQLPDYLSGILIGHELRELAPAGGVVHLIGQDALLARYGHALRSLGCEPVPHGEDLAAQGLWRLARAAG
jgi:2-dehydro-3-deoxygalactonokinase